VKALTKDSWLKGNGAGCSSSRRSAVESLIMKLASSEYQRYHASLWERATTRAVLAQGRNEDELDVREKTMAKS
jgi:hypothetical protein